MSTKSEALVEEGKKVQENSILLMLNFSSPGLRRSVARTDIADSSSEDAEDFAVQIDADPDMVYVSKQIINSPEFRDIQSHRNGIKRALSNVGFKNIFRSGCFLVSLDTLNEIDSYVEGKVAEDGVLVNKFIAAYPGQKEQAKKLRALYNEADYPTVEALKASFKITKRYFTFSTPTSLKGINKEVYDREREKTEEFWRNAASQVESALCASFSGLVNHAVDRLTGAEDGKPKMFGDAALKKINNFLAVFEKRNLTRNGELEVLVNKAKKVISGLDGAALREGQVRDSVKKGFEPIKKALDSMMMQKPGRKIRL